MKFYIVIFLMFSGFSLHAQDINLLLKEADNFEKQQKGIEALEKYKQLLILDPVNMKSLIKAAEISLATRTVSLNEGLRVIFSYTFTTFAWRRKDIYPLRPQKLIPIVVNL